MHDLFQTCGNDCDLPQQTLTDDRDEQNSAVNGQMLQLRRQLLILDDLCTIEGTTKDTSPSPTLCETIRSEVQKFTEKIVVYVRMYYI